VSNSIVEIYSGSDTSSGIVSKANFVLPFIIEGAWKHISDKGIWNSITHVSGGSRLDWLRVGYDTSTNFYYQKRVGGTISIYEHLTRTAPSSFVPFKWIITSTNSYYFENNQQINTVTTQDRYSSELLYLQFFTWDKGKSQYDYVFVRKYSSTEPTVTITDMGTYYKIKLTNTGTTDLTNYQIAIPISDLGISSSSESIKFSDISPVVSVGLNQNITYTEFKVNYDVTHSCYYNNVSEEVSEVNLTLTATNLNDSTTLYTQTFVNVSENQTVSYTYTIQQTDAHDTIQFTCTYTDELGNYLSETINKTVENSLPTTPTNLSITGIPKVSEQINFTVTGSTDADGDSITYYYQVYNLNDEEVKQAYNTTNHYTIQVSDAHDILVIYVKAYDGFNYSGNISESVSVQNSNPEITSVNLPSTLFIKDTLNFSVNFTDIDNDTLMTLEVYIMDGSTALLKRVTNYTTGQLTNFSIPADYWGNQTLQFKIIDAYNGYDEQNITQYVKWANVTFNYLNELDRTTMSTNSLSNKVMTIEYEDDTTTLYTSFETNLVFDKPVESVKFSYTSGSNTFRREYTLNGGTETKNIYLIDYTSITPIVTTLYLLGSSGSNTRLEIYTPLDGQISNQILDVSSGVDFIMLPNKEYQIRMYEGDSVRELGKIARAYSGIYYLQITQNLLDLVAVRGNVEWNAEWINDTLRVEFNDSDNQTDYLKLEIFDSENNLVYSSENYGYSQYTFTIISLNKSEQYLLKLTFQKSGITYEEMKYFREGREVLLPTDIPTNFVKMGTILVIILIAILSTAYASSIFTFVVAIITLIFTYFGWISVPYSLIGIFIVIALFKLYLEASREGGG